MRTGVFIRVMAAAAFALAAQSCYQEIDMQRYRKTPTLVLNSIVSPDTVVMASISKTVFFTEYRDASTTVENASVALYVDGKFKETMHLDGSTGMYVSGYRPMAGEDVEIQATSPDGRVAGRCIVPDVVPIESVEASCRVYEDPSVKVWIDNERQNLRRCEVTYRIAFSDEPAVENYYCIRIEDAKRHISLDNIDYSHDDVFLAQQTAVDAAKPGGKIEGREGRTFTDELFDGKRYELKIVETIALYDYPDLERRDRRIIVYALSPEYYKYLTGILNEDESSLSGSLIKFGFAEPRQHYSNIQGGTGIVGGVQSCASVMDVSSAIRAKI